jgi:hypothetical protein
MIRPDPEYAGRRRRGISPEQCYRAGSYIFSMKGAGIVPSWSRYIWLHQLVISLRSVEAPPCSPKCWLCALKKQQFLFACMYEPAELGTTSTRRLFLLPCLNFGAGANPGRANLSCWANFAPLVYPPTMFHCSSRERDALVVSCNRQRHLFKKNPGWILLTFCLLLVTTPGSSAASSTSIIYR